MVITFDTWDYVFYGIFAVLIAVNIFKNRTRYKEVGEYVKKFVKITRDGVESIEERTLWEPLIREGFIVKEPTYRVYELWRNVFILAETIILYTLLKVIPPTESFTASVEFGIYHIAGMFVLPILVLSVWVGYRTGRTGAHMLHLSKPGQIKVRSKKRNDGITVCYPVMVEDELGDSSSSEIETHIFPVFEGANGKVTMAGGSLRDKINRNFIQLTLDWDDMRTNLGAHREGMGTKYECYHIVAQLLLEFRKFDHDERIWYEIHPFIEGGDVALATQLLALDRDSQVYAFNRNERIRYLERKNKKLKSDLIQEQFSRTTLVKDEVENILINLLTYLGLEARYIKVDKILKENEFQKELMKQISAKNISDSEATLTSRMEEELNKYDSES